MLRWPCMVYMLAANSLLSSTVGNYQDDTNSPLAEQRNAVLRKVETMCAYMNQTTFLWFLRRMLYTMNRQVAGMQ
jgi:hypothetical protein